MRPKQTTDLEMIAKKNVTIFNKTRKTPKTPDFDSSIINILNFDIEQDFIYNEFETMHKNKFNQFYKEIIKGL